MVDNADISAEELQSFRDQIMKVQHEFDSAQQETNQLLAEIQHKNAVIGTTPKIFSQKAVIG